MITVIGAGGFAKEVLAILEQTVHNTTDVNVFTEDMSVNGYFLDKYPIVHELDHSKVHIIAIGTPKARRKFAEQGLELLRLIDPSVRLRGSRSTIGVGSIVCAGSTVTEDAHIGTNTLVNLHCTVAHDVTIGNNCVISPGCIISGKVTIGNNVELGSSATILPGVKIGDNAVVGAGAVVTKDVLAGATVVGIPAKMIKLNGNVVM